MSTHSTSRTPAAPPRRVAARLAAQRPSSGAAALIACLSCASVAAQDARGQDALAAERVVATLDAPQMDQAPFLELVRAGERALPGLVLALGDWQDQRADAVRRRSRALRVIRLIGPPIGEPIVATLLDGVACDISRGDDELLLTLAVVGPGVADRPALAEKAAVIRIVAPKPQLDMAAFRRWVDKMKLWYRFRLRLQLQPVTDVAALIQKLEDEDPLQREFAAEQLGRLGLAARAAIDALVKTAATPEHPRVTRLPTGSLTADFHDMVRDAAAIAVARIDPARPEARRGLTLLLQADAPQERFAAVMALAPAADPEAFDVVPAVLAATAGDDQRVAAEAVTALARLGDKRAEVVERLRQCAESPAAEIASRAKAALRTLAPAAR